MSLLREERVEGLENVKEAYLESDGRVSVISRQEQQNRGTPDRKAR